MIDRDFLVNFNLETKFARFFSDQGEHHTPASLEVGFFWFFSDERLI
jgi:hypothetical protein